MLAIVGDIHGDVRSIQRIDDEIVSNPNITAVIQVGDWGWYSFTKDRFKTLELKNKWYWIDGNHEDHRLLENYETVTEVLPNQFFVPRGTVLEFDGKRIAFMGGAGSVDALFNSKWSRGEAISYHDITKLDDVGHVDLLITHCPPQWFIQKHFDPNDLLMFGLPTTWTDPNADIIEDLSKRLGDPLHYCGHMHRDIIDRNVHLINIDQIVYL